MTLAVERHRDAIWLMIDGRPLAQFADQEAVALFWDAYNRAMLVAREVGRAGIG